MPGLFCIAELKSTTADYYGTIGQSRLQLTLAMVI
jgi:hypothetical protein